jgi:hypothetical protein
MNCLVLHTADILFWHAGLPGSGQNGHFLKIISQKSVA